MSSDIAELLEELRQDHRNLSVLLNLLEKESDAIYSGGDANLELMCNIMRYMTVYPDAVHHPKEDMLYAELRAVRPDLAHGLGQVSDQHQSLEQQGLELLRHIEEVLEDDSGESHRDIVTQALRYVEYLRRHMRWEESDLFRRLDRMVAEGHAVTGKAVIVGRPDPLFGNEVEERYKVIYRCIAGDP